jgi:hypothetical protein
LDADAGETPEEYFVEMVLVFWRCGGLDSQECPADGGWKCRSRSECGRQGWWVNGIFFVAGWWLGQVEVLEFQSEGLEKPAEAAAADFQEDIGLGEVSELCREGWLGGRTGWWGLNC